MRSFKFWIGFLLQFQWPTIMYLGTLWNIDDKQVQKAHQLQTVGTDIKKGRESTCYQYGTWVEFKLLSYTLEEEGATVSWFSIRKCPGKLSFVFCVITGMVGRNDAAEFAWILHIVWKYAFVPFFSVGLSNLRIAVHPFRGRSVWHVFCVRLQWSVKR